MEMTIADLLKYIEFLGKKEELLAKKVAQVECVKITQRILSTQDTTKVVEQTEFNISPKELTSEYDSVAKELRLARQTLERINHTTPCGFKASF